MSWQWRIMQNLKKNCMVPTKKTDSNSRTFQDFFHFFQDFLHQSSRTFPGLSRKRQDFPGGLRSSTNSNNKISFLQDKNIHPVVFIYINNSSFYRKITNKYLSYYILLYQSLTPGNWSLILTFWLKGWKAESNYWTWFFSQYKWLKDGVHQVCLAFFGTT